MYGVLVVAVEVPLVEQPIVVDYEERRRPACIKVFFEAFAVVSVARDALDLGGITIVRGQLVEAGDGGSVVDGASGELLVVFVVGLSPKDGPRQVEVGRRQIPSNHSDQREQKERTRAYSQ